MGLPYMMALARHYDSCKHTQELVLKINFYFCLKLIMDLDTGDTFENNEYFEVSLIVVKTKVKSNTVFFVNSEFSSS